MYLENCPRSHATPSTFAKVLAWLGVAGRRTSPFERVRCLFLRSCHWVLNTLMFMVHVKPFDDEFVLPHWYMARYLLANNPPPFSRPCSVPPQRAPHSGCRGRPPLRLRGL